MNTIISTVFILSLIVAALLVAFAPAATTLLALAAVTAITAVIGLVANSNFSLKTLCA